MSQSPSHRPPPTGGRDPSADARTERLRRAIEGLRAAGHEVGAGAIDLAPKSAHEALTRQMVSDLAADVGELKSRVNTMLWLVAGAVLVDVAMRLMGLG